MTVPEIDITVRPAGCGQRAWANMSKSQKMFICAADQRDRSLESMMATPEMQEQIESIKNMYPWHRENN